MNANKKNTYVARSRRKKLDANMVSTQIIAKDVLEGHSTHYIEKVGGSNYMAIGLSHTGHVTVFFEYEAGTAEIKTA